MPRILLSMLSDHPLKNRMLSTNLETEGQRYYDFAAFYHFLQSSSPLDRSVIQGLQGADHLIINGHGDLSVEHEGPVIASEDRIYTASEFYQELAPILRKLPHIKKLDLLACNLGIEYDQKPSFLKALSDLLSKEFPELVLRTFIPQSSETHSLVFVTESDGILRHYQGKTKPADMLPEGYFEILEHTASQAQEREEIIKKGAEINQKFEKIVDSSGRLVYDVNHSAYLSNIYRQESAREDLQKVYQTLHDFQDNLDDYEKNIIKSHLAVTLPLSSAIVDPQTIEKLYTDLKAVQHAINLRERRWDQINGFVKVSAPLRDVSRFIRSMSSEAEEESKNETLASSDLHPESKPTTTPSQKTAIKSTLTKNAGLALATSSLLYASGNDTDLSLIIKTLAVMIMIQVFSKLYAKRSLVFEGIFGKKNISSASSANDTVFNQKDDQNPGPAR